LGLLRLIAIILITALLAGLIFYYHASILNHMWARPESVWFIWLWYVVSYLLSLFLIGISAIMAYLIAQILFSAFIMDLMSRITESMMTGQVKEPRKMPLWRTFFFLVRQEIPRTILPVLLSLLVMILGWVTPLGPVLTLISSAIAVIFLAWDNTDLVPARRLASFRERWNGMVKTLPFHLGFGLLFLIPGFNILFLSFAPIGGTLYHIERND